MFIGLGIGRGQIIRDRIENQDFEANHKITFSNDFVKEVYVVGQNSIYLFYVLEGETEVSVAAVSPNIKVIQKIKEKEKK